MSDTTQALILGVGGLILFNVGFVGLLLLADRRFRRRRGQGAPKWVPDPAPEPVDDLLKDDDELIEAVEIAWLRSIPTLPYDPEVLGA